MKLEVDYMVETLKTVLKPIVEEGSIECSNIDLTKELGFSIQKVIYNESTQNLIIIMPDRPEKSAVIGKGGWVVGRLREELGVNSIHVDAFSDMLIRIYRMDQALAKLEKIIPVMENNTSLPLKNLQNLLSSRMNNLGGFNFLIDHETDLIDLRSKQAKKIDVENSAPPKITATVDEPSITGDNAMYNG